MLGAKLQLGLHQTKHRHLYHASIAFIAPHAAQFLPLYTWHQDMIVCAMLHLMGMLLHLPPHRQRCAQEHTQAPHLCVLLQHCWHWLLTWD